VGFRPGPSQLRVMTEERAELDAQQIAEADGGETLEKSGGTLCATPSYSSWV
jgi:hypothetical protein